jgi:hypothetical protein
MSHALCETISVQNLVKEIDCIFDMQNPITDFCITCHEGVQQKMKHFCNGTNNFSEIKLRPLVLTSPIPTKNLLLSHKMM